IPDVAVVDFAAGAAGNLYPNSDSDRGSSAIAEDVASLFPAKLTSSPCITSKVKDVKLVEVFDKGEPDAGASGGGNPAAVGDEGDDTAIADAIGGPAEAPEIGIVEAIFVGRGGFCCVGVFDSTLEGWVFQDGAEVVGAGLSNRVGRIADDDVTRRRGRVFDCLNVMFSLVNVEG